MNFSPNASDVYRDHVTKFVPSSGNNHPAKPEIRAYLRQLEDAINGLSVVGTFQGRWDASAGAFPSGAQKGYSWIVGTPGTVGGRFFAEGDQIIALINGASTSVYAGNWVAIPAGTSGIVNAVDAGAGMANAIQVATEGGGGARDGVLLTFTAFRATTASPITVSVDGGPALTVKTNTGANASALSVGQFIAGQVRTGAGELRMLNDQDVAALVAQAEGFAAAAQAAAAGVTLPSAVPLTLLRQKADLSGYETITATQLQDFTTQASYAATAGGLRQWGTRIVIGNNALASLPQANAGTQSLIVIGNNAAGLVTDASGGIIIGHDAAKYATMLSYQIIGIGHRVFRDLTPAGTGLGDEPGGRNTAVGALSSVFMTTGYQNTTLGRNSGGGVSTGYQNTALGTDALGGYGPTGLSGEIQNFAPITGFQITAAGYRAGKSLLGGSENTLYGARAASALKNGGLNVAIGSGALINGESQNGITGNIIKNSVVRSSTYVVSGSTVTVTTPSAHGAAVGDTVLFTYTSGPIFARTADTDVPAVVLSVPSSTTITFAAEGTPAGSGNCTVNQVIGQVAGGTVTQAVVVGRSAAPNYLSGQGLVAVGYNAALNLTGGANGTFLGRFSGANNVDGSLNTSFGDNVTCIGQGARVSGNNQLQLGDTATTVYAQSAVQVRSDERDKADIRETVLGLDFIRKVGAVDFRYDMREDYIEPFHEAPAFPDIVKPDGLEMPGVEPEDDDSEAHSEWLARKEAFDRNYPAFVERAAEYERAMEAYQVDLAAWQAEKDEYEAYWASWFKKPTRDGSKKRGRFHHGVIAQQLKSVMDDLEIDFGGLQDHSLMEDGKDVFTVRYEEFIAPLIRSTQELADVVDRQQETIDRLQAMVEDLTKAR